MTMTERLELVVFDWDGTLVDSTAAIAEAIQQAASDLGLARPSLEQANHVIGLGLQDALRLATPDLRPEQMPAFIDRYRVHYLRRDAELKPFPGAGALLAELDASGALLAVATGKSRVGLERAMAQTGWRHHFDATRCADEGHPKPHPWMLLDLCQALDVDPARTVMIGDTTHDLQMARDAGAHAVAVGYGAHPVDALARFETCPIVPSIAALREWLAPRVVKTAPADPPAGGAPAGAP